MSKKQIASKIKELEDKILDLKNISKNVPEYSELIKKADQLKEEYFKHNLPIIEQYRDQVYELKKELKKPVKELYISENLQEWFRNWKSGVDFGYKDPYIRWISPDEKYVVITCPGSTAGTGTAMGTSSYYYALTDHYLVEVKEGSRYININRDGSGILGSFEGRLSKEKINEWMKLIEVK